MANGYITTAGPAITHRGATVLLPKAHVPLVQFLAALESAMLPCLHCHKWFGCGCVDWLEDMAGASRDKDADNVA